MANLAALRISDVTDGILSVAFPLGMFWIIARTCRLTGALAKLSGIGIGLVALGFGLGRYIALYTPDGMGKGPAVMICPSPASAVPA